METISRQESQYARSLIEASLDPLVTISTEGKITDMNEALANITGMTREKLTGTDLDYLNRRTKSDPTLMMEMISLYLRQTPPLIFAMKQSLQDQDWNSLHAGLCAGM